MKGEDADIMKIKLLHTVYIKTLLICIVSLNFIIVFTAFSYADTIYLIDGSVMTGKILEKNKDFYIFTNSMGTFKIKKNQIKKIKDTDSNNKDADASKDLDKKADEDSKMKKDGKEIEKKQESDQKEKLEAKVNVTIKIDKEEKKIAKKEKPQRKQWDYGRLTFSATYFSAVLNEFASSKTISEVLPFGISAQIGYEHGLDGTVKKRHFMMPGIRVEFSFLFFRKNLLASDGKYEITGYSINAGLMWAFPSLINSWGSLIVCVLPGGMYLDVKNREAGKTASTITLSTVGLLGYEYQFKVFALQIHFRYTYIYDAQVAFHGVGASVGFAFKLW